MEIVKVILENFRAELNQCTNFIHRETEFKAWSIGPGSGSCQWQARQEPTISHVQCLVLSLNIWKHPSSPPAVFSFTLGCLVVLSGWKLLGEGLTNIHTELPRPVRGA